MTARVALLIDGDNIGAKHAAKLQQIAAALGRVDIARVYGGKCPQTAWLDMPGIRFMHAGEGKNAADLLLSIDAMEFAFSGGIEHFALASSDGDFTHLAFRLREMGRYVLGAGDRRAPAQFRGACSAFRLLPEENLCASAAAETHTLACGAFTSFDQNIRTVIANNSKNGMGMRIDALSRQMRVEHGTSISELPERTWRKYLSGRPALYSIDPPGPEAMVRFKREGFQPH